MKITSALASLLAVCLLCNQGCKKKDDSSSKFKIIINDLAWAVNDGDIKAVYYPKFHHLFVDAQDYAHHFLLGVSMDTSNPLKNYTLEANSENSASIVLANDSGYYMSDINSATVGGEFSLNAFDTVYKKISCNFQLVCYTGDGIYKKTISSTLTDLPLVIDTFSDVGNRMTCTVNGVKITNWQSKEWSSIVTCGSTSLDFSFRSLGSPRSIDFRIPLGIGTGTYPVLPYTALCDQSKVTAKYDLGAAYFPTSGTINITNLDVAQKKLEAVFNLDLKDSTTGDHIQITNGSIKLNTWKDKP
jgi:hypothetical protein